jgi:hypothetical protein
VAEDAEQVAATYFSAWKAKDFETFRSLLADDVVFDGPLGHVDGADICAQSVQRLSEIVTDLVVQKRFVNGPDVLTWFDLHTSVAPPCHHEGAGHRDLHARVPVQGGQGLRRPDRTGNAQGY